MTDVVLTLLEHLAQFNAFLDLPFLFEQLDVLLSRQDRELIGSVERMYLLLRTRVKVRLTDLLCILNHTAVLLSIEHKATVSQVSKVQVLLV